MLNYVLETGERCQGHHRDDRSLMVAVASVRTRTHGCIPHLIHQTTCGGSK